MLGIVKVVHVEKDILAALFLKQNNLYLLVLVILVSVVFG